MERRFREQNEGNAQMDGEKVISKQGKLQRFKQIGETITSLQRINHNNYIKIKGLQKRKEITAGEKVFSE